MTGADIQVAVRGSPADASAQVRRRIAQAARESGILVADLRVRLTLPERATVAPVLAQANAYADGHPVRIQITAPTLGQATDALCERTHERLTDSTRAWSPRPWPEAGRPIPPLHQPATAGRIARVKAYALAVCRPEVAAATMDALDFDIHLFTDQETGDQAVVHHAGPTGYRLVRLHPAAPPRQTRLPLAVHPRPAPYLTATAAAVRLDHTGALHLFFAEPSTGCGYVLYRRYDGDYALLHAAP